jgi:DNA-directed RNA polymerase subunit M/transcription elongation factor TFIIS
MQFCKSCGGVLNLFETNDEQICRACEKNKPQKSVAEKKTPPVNQDDLDNAVFSIENNSIVLKAEEGWVLWSGPADKPVTLGSILKRAHRIHQIRSKRNRPKN